MAAGAMIGNLAVNLTMETAAFERGVTIAEKRLSQLSGKFQTIGAKMQGIGKRLSTFVTLPLVGIGAAGIKMAGDFEQAMNGVAISTQATGANFEKLRDLALDIGKSTVFGASEAAGAFEGLAKIGLTTEQILGGAGRAAANLAASVGSKLEPAAIAIADTLQQFKLKVSDLPQVVNQITGAVNQSKLSFEDYQMAIGMAGGAAGALGVSFEDFNASIAATSALFSSGSDAGTSFKTFLTRLVPQSKEAAAAIQAYGLAFFDASGKLLPMAQVAGQLQEKLGGLSDEAKTDVLKTIFGTDAMRTAIGLMDQGAAGLDKIAAKIAEADAAAQSAKRMEGFSAQMKELGGAFETLAIRVADAGMLTAITGLVTELAGVVSTLSEMNPLILQAATVLVVVAAAAGPVVFVFGSMVKLFAGVKVLTLFASGLTGIGVASGTAAYGATAAGIAFRAMLGPIGLAITAATAIYLAWKNWDKITAIVQRVYMAVKTWLVDKLGGIVASVKQKIDAVTGFFRNMYDKVVGNSYVPDMVDGIAAQMARLDAVMVQPVKDATSKAAAAFRDLQQQTAALLDRLFPEARAANQFAADTATLEAAARAGEISIDQMRAALERLYGTLPKIDETKAAIEATAPAADTAAGAFERMAEKSPFENWAATVPQTAQQVSTALQGIAVQGFDSLADAITGVITGTQSLAEAFGNLAKQVISDIIRMTLRMLIFRAVSGMFGGAMGGAGAGNDIVVTGFPSGLPKMAGGGEGVFGGFGGVDRNLLSLNGSPIARVSKGENFSVSPANDAGRTRVVVELRDEMLAARIVEGAGMVVDMKTPGIVGQSVSTTFNAASRPALVGRR